MYFSFYIVFPFSLSSRILAMKSSSDIFMLIPYSSSRICSFSSGVSEKDSSVFRRKTAGKRSAFPFPGSRRLYFVLSFFGRNCQNV